MATRQVVLAGLIAALTAACAPTRTGLVRRDPVRKLPRGTRADFAPGRLDDVFARAVALVSERGLRVDRCERGTLTTAPADLDARCGGTTCLARDVTSVQLGHRRARVTVRREVWNPTVRAWVVQEDASTVKELSAAERELVTEMVVAAERPARRARERRREDPCALAACSGGTCVAASASPPR